MRISSRLSFIALCLFVLIPACTQPRVKRYQSMLDPLLGSGKKKDVTKALGGPPAVCKPAESFEKCEYRTAAGRNEQVPRIFKNEGFGPDVSPYEFFDVLEVQFDSMGIFKDWQPVYLH